MIEALQRQLGGPRDGALLRYSLGHALLGQERIVEAIASLREAVRFDPTYSAAWKLLGQALLRNGDSAAACDTWRQGISVAETRGDTQAAKEMRVFLRRAEKAGNGEVRRRSEAQSE